MFTPPSSNRGEWASKLMRPLPDVRLSPCPPGYARIVAQGWDSVQEAYAFQPTPSFIDLLEAAQARAQVIDESDGMTEVEIGGHPFKVSAHGAKRYRWRIENDDFIILIAQPKHDWAISVRYLAAGLWEHGWQALRERVMEILRPVTFQRQLDCVRVTRADWCFDFYAPTLADEMHPGAAANTVAHSSVRKFETQTVGIGDRSQTLTIGSRSSLQLQLYDKTREITEQSGKTWLYDVWIASMGGKSPWRGRPQNIWRLEIRFFRQFLKDRNCRLPHRVQTERDRLIAEALFTRRWAVPQESDRHRQRWPLHPIWSEAYRQRGAPEMLPLGRKVTGRRHELAGQALKQIMGTARSATVLQLGKYDDAKARIMLHRAAEGIEKDPRHQEKVDAARVRYSDVDEAR